MKIEIWSDYACPFCYMGKRHLEIAMEQFGNEDIEVVYRSFQLDPDFKKVEGMNIHEIISKKYNIPLERAKASNDSIVEAASRVDLNYDFDHIQPSNTMDAHRLTKLAASENKEEFVANRLFQAYFEEGKDLSNHEVLLEIAREAKLDEGNTLAVLNSSIYQKEVQKEQAIALQLGINSVPLFVFNEQFTVSGAQPIELFIQALNKIAFEMNESHEEEGSCCGGSCGCSH